MPDNVGIAVAAAIATVAADELFAGFGSVVAEATVAVFVTDPPAAGALTTSVNVVEAPLLSVAAEQVIVVDFAGSKTVTGRQGQLSNCDSRSCSGENVMWDSSDGPSEV